MTTIEQCLLTLVITVPCGLMWIAYELHLIHLAIEGCAGIAKPSPEEEDGDDRSRDRDEWKHEAAEQQRLK